MMQAKHAHRDPLAVDAGMVPYDPGMGRKIDIGGYFEKLTKKAEGGRRLDVDGETSSEPRRPARRTTRPPTSQSAPSGGGLGDRLRDALGRGRKTAQRTTERVRETTKKRRSGRRTTAPDRARRLPPEGVVTIEYSPRIDGDPDPGEVVWAWVPFEEDPEQGKDRPVVVVGRRGRKLVGVPLTTKRSGREAQIAIGTGDWDPKRRQSYARIWRMLDLKADGMRREGAVLDRDRFDQVVSAVDEYYEIRHASKATADDADFDYDY